MRSWISKPIGAAIAAGAIAIGAGVISDHHPAPPPGGGGGTFAFDCSTGDFDAANSTQLGTAVTSASAGDVIRLTASTSYGTWAGTNKAITICTADGVNPTMGLNLATGDSNFTIDGGRETWDDTTGLTLTGGSFTGTPGPQNITIQNFWATGSPAGGLFEIDGPTNSNIVFDHGNIFDLPGDPTTEAAFRFPYDGPSGVTIQNSVLRDMASDGIKIGASHTSVLNNLFLRITCTDCGLQHTDNVQLCCGYSSGSDTGSGSVTITGNIFDNGGQVAEQAIGIFDGTGNNTITHNVVRDYSAWGISVAGDSPGSTVEWNTVENAQVGCGSKQGDPTSTTIFRNNIFQQGIDTSGIGSPAGPTCTPTNSNNFTAAPSFVGGANPTTMAGFCLAGPSGALTGATTGGQVGACGNGFTGGPPETYP